MTDQQHNALPANRWCILRTAGPRTLPLAASLTAAGIEAWTPVEMVKRRIPRKVGRVEKAAPLLPTFVFVPALHLYDLWHISRMPVSPHPAFAFFRHNGAVPLIAQSEVDKLRVLENRMKPKRRRPTVPIETEVCPTEGAYAGMTGVVKESDGKTTLVAFGGWMSVKIETSILIDGGVYGALRYQAPLLKQPG
jgi:hypothetical protein